MSRTCALCGWRPSVTLTDWDDRRVPACAPCMGYEAPKPDVFNPHGASLSLRVANYILGPGAHGVGATTISLALGVAPDDLKGRNAVSRALSRLVALGFVAGSGSHNERLYRPGPKPIEQGQWWGVVRGRKQAA